MSESYSCCGYSKINMNSMDFTVFGILTVLSLLSLIDECITLANPVCMLRPSNTDNMKYYLYNKNGMSRLAVNEDTIKRAPFVYSRSLIIIIHGYTGHYDDAYITTLRNGYLKAAANRNVVMVDYSSITANVSIFDLGTLYVKWVLCDVPDIAKKIADLVVLTQTTRSHMNHVHLLGHSLGAQIAGQVGKHYIQLTGNLVDRVTALDPAGPFFEGSPRVNTRIAKFVDVVHTNINILGYVDPIGTVDFYINNGVIQAACLGGGDQKIDYLCSHISAVLFYAESINNIRITAIPCSEIEELVKNKINVLAIDTNNDNAISTTCSKKPAYNAIVFGEHVSLKSAGVYYISMSTIPFYNKDEPITLRVNNY